MVPKAIASMNSEAERKYGMLVPHGNRDPNPQVISLTLQLGHP